MPTSLLLTRSLLQEANRPAFSRKKLTIGGGTTSSSDAGRFLQQADSPPADNLASLEEQQIEAVDCSLCIPVRAS
jgi:hypothetical protein